MSIYTVASTTLSIYLLGAVVRIQHHSLFFCLHLHLSSFWGKEKDRWKHRFGKNEGKWDGGEWGEKAAIPHCDFTLGWLEQSVEGLASISLQNTHGEEKNTKRKKINKQDKLMKWDIHSEKPFQTVSPHALHGILRNISWLYQ